MRKPIAWAALAIVGLVVVGGGVKSLSDLAVEEARQSAYGEGQHSGYVMGADATLEAFEEGCNLVYEDERATTVGNVVVNGGEIVALPACSFEHVQMWNQIRGDGENKAKTMRPQANPVNIFTQEPMDACDVTRLSDGCSYFHLQAEEWAPERVEERLREWAEEWSE